MTQNTLDKYEQLKQVIQRANPEIMELKFGCEVKAGKIIVCDYRKLTNDYAMNVVDPYGYTRTYIVQDVNSKEYKGQVLGRPIRLADVLEAIRVTNIEKWNSLTLPDVAAYWYLLDDNLDHQSEETKQFLIDLLCKTP